MIALGGLPDATATAVEDAIESAGGEVSQVAVVGEPPDLEALASTLDGRRARAVADGDEAELNALGVDAGRVLTRGGPRFDDLRARAAQPLQRQPRPHRRGRRRQRPPRRPRAPTRRRATGALEDGLLAGLRSVQLPVVGAELSTTDPSTIGFFDPGGLSSVDSVDLLSGKVALVYALKGGVEGSFGVKLSADSLLPDLLTRAEVERAERSRPQGAASRARAAAEPMLAGLVVSAALAAILAGPWLADMARTGLTRTNYAGREVAFPGGAVLVSCSLLALAPLALLDDRADLDLLEPDSDAMDRLRPRGGDARPARRRARPRRRGRHRAGLARPCPGGALRRLLDRGDQGGRGARPRRVRRLRPRARGSRLPRRPPPPAAGDEPVQPPRPPARAGREGVRRPARRPLHRRLRPSTRSSCSGSSSARSWSAPGSRCASGRCSATPARTSSERSPACRCSSRSAIRRRLVALAIVLGLTIYGEFRSLSATIDAIPPLRWLDSLGRVNEGELKR